MSEKVDQIIAGIKQEDDTRTVFGIEIGPDKKCKSVADAFGERYSQFNMGLTLSLPDKHEGIRAQLNKFLSNFSKELNPNEDPKEILEGAIDYCSKTAEPIQKECDLTREWAEGNGEKNSAPVEYLGMVASNYRISAACIGMLKNELYPEDSQGPQDPQGLESNE